MSDANTPELPEDLLNAMRLLSEKYFGNETYGKYLNFNHELQKIFQKHLKIEKEQAIIAWRDLMSTNNRPLSEPPLIIKQPVPCARCGATEYADWTLYPHQLYNKYMPGGIGHYCFDCFAAIVSDLATAVQDARIDELKFISDKDFVYKDYKYDDCVSLARINGRLAALQAKKETSDG